MAAASIETGSRPRLAFSRRGLLALCLAALLALLGANLLYAGMDRGEPPLTGAPGDLLYAAAFDGFPDEWTVYDGRQRAAIDDGELELVVSDAQTATWTATRHNFDDFDMRVTARAIAGPVDNGFGVIFRLQVSAERGCDLPAVILCALDDLLPLAGAMLRGAMPAPSSDGYYAFLISSDGFYSLWQASDGAARLRSAWMPAPQINIGLGAVNRLRVIGEGATYRFMVNGAAVSLCLPDDPLASSTFYAGECLDGALSETFVDEALMRGALGLIVQTTASGGGAALRFDDLLVYAPGAASQDARL